MKKYSRVLMHTIGMTNPQKVEELLLKAGWTPGITCKVMSPLYPGNTSDGTDDIQVLYDIAPYIKEDEYIIFSFEEDGQTKWLHLIYEGGKVREVVTEEEEWLEKE